MIDPNNISEYNPNVPADKEPEIYVMESGQQDGKQANTPPAGTSSQTTTVNTSGTSPIQTKIPEQFTGDSNKDLITWLEQRLNEYKPLSKEDLEKLRKKQRAEKIISGISDAVKAVSNLAFTSQYAPNMYDPKNSMSAKAKERFEKEKAEREAKDDKWFNYALTIGKLKDAEKQRGLDAWKTEQTFLRQDRAYNDGRKDRQDDLDFRNKEFDRQGDWHDKEAAFRDKQFEEGARQFNISSANESKRINLEAKRLARDLEQGKVTFNLGTGNGNITLSSDKLNAQTVSRIFNTLPQNVRKQVGGEPIYEDVLDKNGNPAINWKTGKPQQKIVGYRPSTEAMLIAIGANVETSPATQNAIKQVAGLEKEKKPKAY